MADFDNRPFKECYSVPHNCYELWYYILYSMAHTIIWNFHHKILFNFWLDNFQSELALSTCFPSYLIFGHATRFTTNWRGNSERRRLLLEQFQITNDIIIVVLDMISNIHSYFFENTLHFIFLKIIIFQKNTRFLSKRFDLKYDFHRFFLMYTLLWILKKGAILKS